MVKRAGHKAHWSPDGQEQDKRDIGHVMVKRAGHKVHWSPDGEESRT